uniref:DB domain-containing protein n=1 Tax=Caenorhabditis japonica TaxID=281687 RepID=A0A8R1IBF7_CAEJA
MNSSLLVVFFLLAVAARFSEACFASGICGGGCMPPPPPVCSGGCGGGYSCGSYGCYRARARGSKTLSFKKDTEQSPDERFMKCCEERNLPDSCLSKCSYRSYTKSALQAMYFKQDTCPMQAAADIQYCAAQGKDHTACCARNAVGTTLAGSKCFTFCDQRPGTVTQLDLSYLACYDRFENMKACFYQKASEGSMSFNTDDVDEQEQQQERFAFAEPAPAFRAPAQPAQPADPLAAVQQLLAKTFGQ